MLASILNIFLILSCVTLVTLSHKVHHHCTHDDIQPKKVPVIGGSTNLHKYHPTAMESLRVKVDYSNLNDPSKYCSSTGDVRPTFSNGGTYTCGDSNDMLTPAKRDFLINQVMTPAIAFLQRALKVNRASGNLMIGDIVCDDALLVPQEYRTSGVPETDFLLHVTVAKPSGDSTLATAYYCALNQEGRPVIGHANFNPKAIDPNTTLSVNATINLAIHEIMHALGFSYSYIQEQMPNATKVVQRRGKDVTLIVTPEVVAKAKQYYNCSTMDGLELEDQGGSGTAMSHWEKRLVGDEVMSGMTYETETEVTVSNLTLAFFKDTGRYDVDYSAADQTYFGRQRGCPFVYEKCNVNSLRSGNGFCFTQQEMGCTEDAKAIAMCNIEKSTTTIPESMRYFDDITLGGEMTMDFCPSYGSAAEVCILAGKYPNDATRAHIHGPSSRCFKTEKLRFANSDVGEDFMRCLPVRCPEGRYIDVMVGDAWLPCPRDGSAGQVNTSQYTEGKYVGNIQCPPARQLCSRELNYFSSSPIIPLFNIRFRNGSLPSPIVTLNVTMPVFTVEIVDSDGMVSTNATANYLQVNCSCESCVFANISGGNATWVGSPVDETGRAVFRDVTLLNVTSGQQVVNLICRAASNISVPVVGKFASIMMNTTRNDTGLLELRLTQRYPWVTLLLDQYRVLPKFSVEILRSTGWRDTSSVTNTTATIMIAPFIELRMNTTNFTNGLATFENVGFAPFNQSWLQTFNPATIFQVNVTVGNEDPNLKPGQRSFFVGTFQIRLDAYRLDFAQQGSSVTPTTTQLSVAVNKPIPVIAVVLYDSVNELDRNTTGIVCDLFQTNTQTNRMWIASAPMVNETAKFINVTFNETSSFYLLASCRHTVGQPTRLDSNSTFALSGLITVTNGLPPTVLTTAPFPQVLQGDLINVSLGGGMYLNAGMDMVAIVEMWATPCGNWSNGFVANVSRLFLLGENPASATRVIFTLNASTLRPSNYSICYYLAGNRQWYRMPFNLSISPCNVDQNCMGQAVRTFRQNNTCGCQCVPGYRFAPGVGCVANCSNEGWCSGNANRVRYNASSNKCDCECNFGFTGPSCNVRESCNARRDCNDRGASITTNPDGTCKCTCENPWLGEVCQYGQAIGRAFVYPVPMGGNTASFWDMIALDPSFSQNVFDRFSREYSAGIAAGGIVNGTLSSVGGVLIITSPFRNISDYKRGESVVVAIASNTTSFPSTLDYIKTKFSTVALVVGGVAFTDVVNASVVGEPCPPSSFKCWNGTCVQREEQCPCHPSTRRCNKVCVPRTFLVNETCPPCNRTLCYNGTCADDASLCSCPANQVFCNKNYGCISKSTFNDIGSSICTKACTKDQIKCWNDECVADASACACPPNAPVRCPGASTCVVNVSICSLQCPTGLIKCKNGTCASSQKDCFSCPYGSVQCPGTMLCVADSTACTPNCQNKNMETCWDGSCATSYNQCPCPPDRSIRCSNSYCADRIEACDSSCPKVRCADGTCAETVNNCTCPLPTFPCQNSNACALRDGQCNNNTCTKGNRCWDGTCRSTCPCHPNTPYRCGDGTCVNTALQCTCSEGTSMCSGTALCGTPADCLSKCSDSQVVCPDATCAATLSDCSCPGSLVRCQTAPFRCVSTYDQCYTGCQKGSVLCPDGICAIDSRYCTCPYHSPLRCDVNSTCTTMPSKCTPVRCEVGMIMCPDRTCKSDRLLCACPAESPVKCPNSNRCAATTQDCSTPCPRGMLSCWNDDCVSDLRDCSCHPSTPVRCPQVPAMCVQRVEDCVDQCALPMVRCDDGTCATSAAQCKCSLFTPYRCPGTNRCVSDASNCESCKDFRCWDGTCVNALDDCPCTVERPYRCQNGLCAQTENGCDKSCASRGLITCRDSSCAETYDKCPCPLNTIRCKPNNTNHYCSEVSSCPTESSCSAGGNASSVCPDGRCKNSGERCPCPYNMPIRCSSGKCVGNLTECGCPDSQASFSCPDGRCAKAATGCYATCGAQGKVLCPDLTCATSFSDCACFGDRPYKCALTGVCMADVTQCEKKCGSSQVKCWDGKCADSEHDCPCPPERPVGCPSGTCVTSKADCKACKQNQIVCWDNTCADKLSQCSCPPERPTRCSTNNLCVASTTMCKDCASGQLRCLDGSCANSLSDCTCPYGSPVRCPWNSRCALSAYDCEFSSSCPTGLAMCSNGTCATGCPCPAEYPNMCDPKSYKVDPMTCVTDTQQCTSKCSAPTAFMCWNGDCAKSREDCPCHYTVPVRCPSGRCGSTEADCLVVCQDPTPFQCTNGTCVANDADCGCPTEIPYRCQLPGFNTSFCTSDMSNCQSSLCPSGKSLCSDNTCQVRCECPADAPFRCLDGNCTKNSTMCACAKDFVRCPAKSVRENLCARSSSDCDTESCSEGKVRCWDMTCKSSLIECGCAPGLTACANNPGLCVSDASSCSEWCYSTEVQCLDGTCKNNYRECECPTSTPIRCSDRRCVASKSKCAKPCTGVQCWDGSCASTFSSCPCPPSKPYTCNGICTANSTCSAVDIKCGDGNILCWDGSCASEVAMCPCHPSVPVRCSDYIRCAVTESACNTDSCPKGYVTCWDGSCAYGNYTGCPCSPNAPKRCSFAPDVCTLNTPCATQSLSHHNHKYNALAAVDCATGVRCWDNTCARTFVECTCPANIPYRCANGQTCAQDSSSCTLADLCSPPNVRCWDSSCVSDAVQCTCPTTLPYKCASGACVKNTAECITNCSVGLKLCWNNTCAAMCDCRPETPFRCSNGDCAVSSSDCSCESKNYCDGVCVPANVTCPGSCSADQVRCPDFSCASDFSSCPCPSNTPVRCNITGWCVEAPWDCLDVCSYDKVPCWDGSCADSYMDCPCPSQRPLKCPNRQCATNRSSCTESCAADQVRCYDSTCAASAADCPCPPSVPFKCPNSAICVASNTSCTTCPVGLVQCWDGSCRFNTLNCPCPPETPELCSNGRCALRKSQCSNSCPASKPLLCPNSECVANATKCRCPPSAPYNCGTFCAPNINACNVPCDSGLSRCWDGTCAANEFFCSCPPTAPYPCSGGRCAADEDTCKKECSVSQVRCADSTCASKLSDCQCFLPATMRCPNGECVEKLSDCSSTIGSCPFELPYFCDSNSQCVSSPLNCTCAAGTMRCQDTGLCAMDCNATCPIGLIMCSDRSCVESINMCPCPIGTFNCDIDGSCVSDLSLCGSSCSSDEIKCWNGACARSMSDCSCPPNTPYRCNDGACAPSASACKVCTDIRCMDGACVKNVLNCTCPPSAPYRCSTTGLCAEDPSDCGYCPTSNVQCWDSECVKSYSECACPQSAPLRCSTSSKCVNSLTECFKPTCLSPKITCWDGTCQLADNCPCPADYPVSCSVSSTVKCSKSKDTCIACPSGKYQCWNSECVATKDKCSCKPDKPHRCSSGVCAVSESECPCPTGTVKCQNFCAASNLTCLSTSACQQSTPVRCSDGSCADKKASCPCYDNITVPEVYIDNPDTTVFDAEWIRVKGSGRYLPCGFQSQVELLFKWTIYDSKKVMVTVDASTNTSAMSLPPFTLPSGTYQVRLGVYRRAIGVVESTAFLNLKVVPRPIRFSIAGGNRTVGTKGTLVLQVIPMDWNPRKNYILRWNCVRDTSSPCSPFENNITEFSGTILRLTVDKVQPGMYTFNVSVVDPPVWRVTSVKVEAANIPEISVIQVSSHRDSTKASTLYAVVRNANQTPSFVWKIGSNTIGTDSALLVIPPSTLPPGNVTRVFLDVTFGSSTPKMSTFFDLTMGAKPINGNCTVMLVDPITKALKRGVFQALNSTLSVTTFGWNIKGLWYRFMYRTPKTGVVYLQGFHQEKASITFTAPLVRELLSLDDTVQLSVGVESKDPSSQTTGEAWCNVTLTNYKSLVSNTSWLVNLLSSMTADSFTTGDNDRSLTLIQHLMMVIPRDNDEQITNLLNTVLDRFAPDSMSDVQRRFISVMLSEFVESAANRYILRRRVMSFLQNVVSDGSFPQADGMAVIKAVNRLNNVANRVIEKEMFCSNTTAPYLAGWDTSRMACFNNSAVARDVMNRVETRHCLCVGGKCNPKRNDTCDCIVQKRVSPCLMLQCNKDLTAYVVTQELKVLNATQNCKDFTRYYTSYDYFFADTLSEFCDSDADCGSANEYYWSLRSIYETNLNVQWPIYTNITVAVDTSAAATVLNTLKNLGKALLVDTIGTATVTSDGVTLTAQNTIVSDSAPLICGNNATDNTTVNIPPSVFGNITKSAGYSATDLTVSLSKVTYSSSPFPTTNINNASLGSAMDSTVMDFSVGYKGDNYPINNTGEWMNLTFKASGSNGNSSNNTDGTMRVCRYYNEQTNAWSTEGVKFMSYNATSNTITCGTRHFSAFGTFVDTMPTAAPTKAPIDIPNSTNFADVQPRTADVPLGSWLAPLIIGCVLGITLAVFIMMRKSPVQEPMRPIETPMIGGDDDQEMMISKRTAPVMQKPLQPNPNDVFTRNPLDEY
eukprot:PhF_6_TR15979/c0_g1_i1/m.25023